MKNNISVATSSSQVFISHATRPYEQDKDDNEDEDGDEDEDKDENKDRYKDEDSGRYK